MKKRHLEDYIQAKSCVHVNIYNYKLCTLELYRFTVTSHIIKLIYLFIHSYKLDY